MKLHSKRTWRVLTVLALVGAYTSVALAQDGSGGWPQFRGPNVDGVSQESGIFTDVGPFTLEVGWKRPIGDGYSGISIVDGAAVTMYQTDDAIVVVAFDADTGQEHWRYAIGDTYGGINGSFPGPLSTPLIAGDAVVALDRRGRLVGLDRASGDLLWSTDLPAEHDARRPGQGFATSPILLNGIVIVQVGGPDAAVAGLDPATGRWLWTTAGDTVDFQTPVPGAVGGRDQVFVAGLTQVMGIEPTTGERLWQHDHGGLGFTGAMSIVPVPAGPDRLFLNHDDHASTVIELTADTGTVVGQAEWEDRVIRNSYNVPVYHNGYLYAFSSRFLICVDAATGELAWRSRPPGDGFLILVDGHLVILTKDGSLHVAEASAEGYLEIAAVQLFDELTWTPPSFADGHIFARSHGTMARVDILPASRLTAAGAEVDAPGRVARAGTFAQFLAEVESAEDKTAVVDRFLDSVTEFPFVEGGQMHFMYRGPGTDLAIAGDLIGARFEHPMNRVTDTDLFYYSADVAPRARVNYHFIRDYEELTDPRNDRVTTTAMYGPEMDVMTPAMMRRLELLPDGASMETSWTSMPGWRVPTHLAEPDAETARGRLVTHELESAVVGTQHTIQVYLPAAYEMSGDETRYQVVYYHEGHGAIARGNVPTSLDNLIGRSVRPLIAVFVEPVAGGAQYADIWANEVIPFIDTTYRTIDSREGRANVGGGWAGYAALSLAFQRTDLVEKVAAMTPANLVFAGPTAALQRLVDAADGTSMDLYMEWGIYDARAPQENWDLRDSAKSFMDFLVDRGYTVAGGEVLDGTGWSSWKNRTDQTLTALFPVGSP